MWQRHSVAKPFEDLFPMPFSQEKLDRVRAGIERSLASGRLNDWERQFLMDMRSRLQMHGRKTTLSEKQYRKLMQLADVGGPSNSAAAPLDERRSSIRAATQPRQRASPRRTYYRRRSRTPWFLRKTVRDLKIAGVLVAFFAVAGLVGNVRETSKKPEPQTASTTGATGQSEAIASGPTSFPGRSITVIDGDTVRVPAESRSVRLVGFNTPEVFSPECSRELQLGELASARLQELLVSGGTVEFQRIACACEPGTEGTEACNFGRICGVLRVDGVDVGRTLIAEGLAARYQCGKYSCPPPPGDWCR